MAMNKYMHIRNIYRNPPDFKKLADNFPQFLSICHLDVTGKVCIDFKDPNALRILTACLLKSDFNLDVSIPEDRLVPTLPLRLNYILWLEDLLLYAQRTDNIKGIDIGTGACAIYPLLGARKNKWHMIGTETDDESLIKARENVKQNNLEGFITLRKNTTNKTLEYLFLEEHLQYDFCMCNPPFYVSLQEVWESRSPARPPPKNGFTGSPQELVTEGGELQFCRQILEESKKIKNNIRIFTSMIGHKYNLKEFLLDLKAEGIKYTTTEFCQGRVTRWGVAWTYQNYDLSKLVSSHNKNKKKKTLITFVIPKLPNQPYNLESMSDKMKLIFDALKIEYKVVTKRKNELCLNIVAYTNTWSNQRRKRRHQKQLESTENKVSKLEAITKSNTNIVESTIVINKNEDFLKKSVEILVNRNMDQQVIENNEYTSGSVNETETNGVLEHSTQNMRSTESKKEELDSLYKITSETSLTAHSSIPEPLSQAIVKIIWKEDLCSISMEHLKGTGGKESLHQILQFIKNNWK